MTRDDLPNLDKVKTGENIKRLMRLNKISIYELQMIFAFQSPRNVYSWTCGNTVPSADNLLKLSYIFKCSIDEILIKEAE